MSKVISAQTMLKKREAWKYADIKRYLDTYNIRYEFEYVVGEFFIYDLVLHDYRLLVEFDGTSHNSKSSAIDDFEKDCVAEENGYEIIRVKVDDNLVIPVEDLIQFLLPYIVCKESV